MYTPVFDITPRLLRFITEATELNSWVKNSIVHVSWLTRARIQQIVTPLVEAGLLTRAGHTRATTYRLR